MLPLLLPGEDLQSFQPFSVLQLGSSLTGNSCYNLMAMKNKSIFKIFKQSLIEFFFSQFLSNLA